MISNELYPNEYNCISSGISDICKLLGWDPVIHKLTDIQVMLYNFGQSVLHAMVSLLFRWWSRSLSPELPEPAIRSCSPYSCRPAFMNGWPSYAWLQVKLWLRLTARQSPTLRATAAWPGQPIILLSSKLVHAPWTTGKLLFSTGCPTGCAQVQPALHVICTYGE